jgi:hypothetical protein
MRVKKTFAKKKRLSHSAAGSKFNPQNTQGGIPVVNFFTCSRTEYFSKAF